MTHDGTIPLRRFPLIATKELGVAKRMTSRFWPPHRSSVIGPDRYSVVMNRVLLGDIAITFTHCTARVRVVPLGRSAESCLLLPLSGSVEIETDTGRYQATPDQPLFRAPVWLRRFEASPARCLVIDVPTAALRSPTRHTASDPALPHTVLRDDDATAISKQVMKLSRMIDRSRSVIALQTRSAEDRRRLLPRLIRREEVRFIDMLAMTVGAVLGQASPARSGRSSSSVEECLRRLAPRGLPITAVARHAGLSVRALQRTCESRGYTPLEFMRSVQLDSAHALLTAAAEKDTVASVAHAVGIMHLGRFSTSYRQRFGESPSATLNRARSSSGESGR